MLSKKLMAVSHEFDQPPYHTNERGVKFWLDRECTEWVYRDPGPGRALQGAIVFKVEEPNGSRTRLLVDSRMQPVEDTPSIEQMAVHIDTLRMINDQKGPWTCPE